MYTRDPALKKKDAADPQLVSRRDEEGKPQRVVHFQVIVQSGRARWLGDSHLLGSTGSRERIRLTLEGTELRVDGEEGIDWGLAARGQQPSAGGGRLELGDGRAGRWLVPMDQKRAHRVIDFNLIPGEQR